MGIVIVVGYIILIHFVLQIIVSDIHHEQASVVLLGHQGPGSACQVTAGIHRYIARQHNMLGNTDVEKAMVDLMAEESMDFRNGWVRLCYNPDFDNLKDNCLTNLDTKLDQFSRFLAKKTWYAGECLTFVDFVMYELIDQHKFLAPNCLKKYPNLEAFQTRFEELPKIAEYMKSSAFMKTPLNNKMAKFGF